MRPKDFLLSDGSSPVPVGSPSQATAWPGTSGSTAFGPAPVETAQTPSGEWLRSPSTFDQAQMVTPVATRDEVRSRLVELEKRYGMTSVEFYDLWQSGNAPDSIETLVWVALWEAWRENYLLDR